MASSTTTICAGNTTNLNDFYGGTWSSSNNAIATVNGSGVVTAVSPGSVTITNTYYTLLSILFGPSIVTTSIAVVGVPTSVSATASPNPICVGAKLTLTGAATGATNYAWASPGGAAIASPSSLSSSVSAVTTANAGVYTLSATNTCGTTKATSAAVSVANGVPTSVTATATPNSICAGSALALTGSATGATSYSWSGPGSASIAAPSSLSTSVVAITTANAGVYTLSATNVCGTTKTTSSAVSVTAGKPSSVTATGTPGAVCSGSTLTLTGAAAGATSYLWLGPGGAAIASPTSLSTSVAGVTTGNAGTYILSATNVCGTTTASATIAVNQSPVISASVSNVTCNGYGNGDVYLGNIVISVSSPGGYTCSWSNGQTSPYGIYSLTAGVYSLTVTDGNGCSTTDAYNVTQPAPITAVASVTNSIGDTTGAINFVVSGGTAPYNYSWSNGATSENLSGLSHGDYCVGVSDANSCTFNDCYYVNAANLGGRSAANGSNDSNSNISSLPVVTQTAAYPNPFTTTINVSFTVPADGHTTVEVFNAVNGQKIAAIFNDDTKAGSLYSCIFDGTSLPSGLYIYKISSENSSYIGKVTLVK